MLRVNNARPAKATQIYSLSASFISHIQLFHASFKNNILRLMSERGYENLRTDALRLSSVCLTEIRPSAGVIRLRADGQRIEFPIAVTADGLDYKRHNATENQDQHEDEDDRCDEAQTHSALIISAHVCRPHNHSALSLASALIFSQCSSLSLALNFYIFNVYEEDAALTSHSCSSQDPHLHDFSAGAGAARINSSVSAFVTSADVQMEHFI
ncbi:hypothetical protein QQF64_010595 [Cirrhinus molitorella]|uniref:Uncharacterized protein n=1 Tax=Cirrhinus molitorella TaxID=172907 RepID=A0ABR3LZA0_9TELE